MTPNPNPIPESVYLGAIEKGTAFILDYGVADVEELVRVADVQPADDVCCKVRLEGVTLWTPEFEFRRRATPVAALSPQTLPAPGEVERLKERIAVLERENSNYAKTMDIIGQLPATPTLATVAAANDEGVDDAIEAAAQIADAYSRGPHAQKWHGENIAAAIRRDAAAIRLLSQGEKA